MSVFCVGFPVEIWGTVSYWVMIVVTSITAYYLYQTLQSQKEVQRSQNKLLEIEQLRLREDFKPILKYSRFDDGMVIAESDRDLISIAVRNVSEYHAINVNPIYAEDNADCKLIFRPNPQRLIKGGEYMPLHFLVKSLSNISLEYYIEFSISYEDVSGIKYEQAVVCRKYFEIAEEIIDFMPKVNN